MGEWQTSAPPPPPPPPCPPLPPTQWNRSTYEHTWAPPPVAGRGGGAAARAPGSGRGGGRGHDARPADGPCAGGWADGWGTGHVRTGGAGLGRGAGGAEGGGRVGCWAGVGATVRDGDTGLPVGRPDSAASTHTRPSCAPMLAPACALCLCERRTHHTTGTIGTSSPTDRSNLRAPAPPQDLDELRASYAQRVEGVRSELERALAHVGAAHACDCR
jgi:hypothetical protein